MLLEAKRNNTAFIQDPAHPLSKGLLGRWILNEGYGTKAYNLIGKRHGVLTNGPQWRNGKYGKAINFTAGSTQYVYLGDYQFFATTRPFSISWLTFLRTSSTLRYQFCINGGGVGFNAGISSAVNYEGIFLGAASTWTPAKSNTVFPLNVWKRCTINYNGNGATTPSNFTFYTDKVPVSGVAAGGIGFTDTINVIGNRGTLNLATDALMDDVRFYNRQLTATEIALLVSDPFCDILKSKYYRVSGQGAPPAPPVVDPDIHMLRKSRIEKNILSNSNYETRSLNSSRIEKFINLGSEA